MEPVTNRRDFLKGKSALRAAEQLLDRALPGDLPPLPPSEPDRYLVKYSRRAMACDFEIWMNAGQYPDGGEVAFSALGLVEEIEAQLTVYRESSEISRLNRTAHESPIEVEPQRFRLLEQCIELWKLSGGAFDITAGPLAELWGFKRRQGGMPSQAAIEQVLERIGTQHLLLDEERGTVQFAQPGMEINLGAIGKGYALDRCATLFDTANIGDYLIHGGNSSVLARGSRAAGDSPSWSVGVRHPLRPTEYLGELHVCNKALSTSGSGTQFFEHAGRRYGHILDPRTGWPAARALAVTAIAATAAEAEALSTACYVLGPEATDRLLAEHREFGCLMLCPGSQMGAIEVHSWNIGEGEWVVPE
jgi:thiamine biosynthesis lipoprotein